ncbi:MAG: carbonic anhydrase [Geminicoccaceae bacterium]
MIDDLFRRNRAWSIARQERDPDFFPRLARQQRPAFLWVGCADSRVPANEIVGLDPGELFVHRNVANLAPPSDINFLSVLSFAVVVLKVQHVIVCGHYGCGGVRAALLDERNGIVDHWLEPVRGTYRRNAARIEAIGSEADRVNALCEFNVQDRVQDVAATTIIRDAWAAGQKLAIHGWIYGLADGLLRNLDVTVAGLEDS